MHLSVFDRTRKKQSDFWSVAVSSRLHRQLSSSAVTRACVCVRVCVWTGYTLLSERRSWGDSQLPCIVAANTQSTQPGPPAGLVHPLSLSLLLSICPNNCDPSVSVSSAHLPRSPFGKMPSRIFLSCFRSQR